MYIYIHTHTRIYIYIYIYLFIYIYILIYLLNYTIIYLIVSFTYRNAKQIKMALLEAYGRSIWDIDDRRYMIERHDGEEQVRR